MQKNKNWKENWSGYDALAFIISETGKRSKGFRHFTMIMDAGFCLLMYGATFHDYINLRFWLRTKKERETFLTTKMVQREKKKWNKEELENVDNKGKFNRVFSDIVTRKWIDMDDSNQEGVEDFVQSHPVFYVKPKRESSGLGVRKCYAGGIEDINTFVAGGSGKILEEPVEICNEMKALNNGSISQIRVVTVNNGTEVNILAATLRSGKHDVEFNTAKDDLFSQIDIETGRCFTDGIDEAGKQFDIHPVSGIRLMGFQIPKWNEVITTCIEAAKRVPAVKVIGWDVAIMEEGITFFEGNPGSGVASMQMADGIGKKKLFYEYLKEKQSI